MTSIRNLAAGLWVLLGPLSSYAAVVDIPEIGVRMLALPSDASELKLTEQFNGYAAACRIGEAQLSIFRLDDQLPPGGSPADSGYRASLEARLGDRLRQAHTEAIAVAGHEGWSRCSSSGFVGNAQYTCIRYVIVDQHVYRLRAYAFDTLGSKKIPPDFERAVQAISNVSFETVQQPGALNSASVPRPPPLPKFHLPHALKYDPYPPAAYRRHEQGIIEAEFSVDGQGHARDVKEIYVESLHLSGGAADALASAVFEVPPTWEEQGYQNLRFTRVFVFALTSGTSCFTEAPTPPSPGQDVVQVCGSLL